MASEPETAERMFPILDGPSIPWRIIEPWEKFARMNHSQTLERLAERGGLASAEAVAILTGQRGCIIETNPVEARRQLLALVDERTQAVPCIVHNMVRQERDDARAEVEQLRQRIRVLEADASPVKETP